MSKSSRLKIDGICGNNNESLLDFFDLLQCVSTIATIYHSETDPAISFELLVQMFRYLPELDSLKVSRLSSHPIEATVINDSKIKKLFVPSANPADFDHLMLLSPQLTCIKLDYMNQKDMNDWLQRLFGIRPLNNDRQRSISLLVKGAGDTMTDAMKKVISEQRSWNENNI